MTETFISGKYIVTVSNGKTIKWEIDRLKYILNCEDKLPETATAEEILNFVKEKQIHFHTTDGIWK